MAVKKAAAAMEAAENMEEAKAEDKKSKPKYTVEKLREKSIHLFGVSQSTFDGAMYGHNEAEYTVSEVKNIIGEWLHGKGGKD
ncbi:MAG: hypothetical protein Q4C77_02870 [Eubacteriales bacterium]|nr:hypothetical protein [Eubacteriales bacterium]